MVSSVATFLVYGHSYGRFSDPDPVVLGLVWTLAVLQLLRSILVIAEPILRSLSPLLQGPALEAFRRLSAPSHALLTFVMRFASIVMVMVATAQKRFPYADCNMWG